MKTVSTALSNYLFAAQNDPDVLLYFAECYTLTLFNGTTLYYTSADVDINWGGVVFSSSGPIISGLKYNSTIGFNVDQQEITIAALPTVTVNGAPFMSALANGAFDLCVIERDRVFFSDHVGGTIIDGVTLFYGRFLRIDECGRFSAKVTVADSMVVLNNNMPRNTWSATCNHVLYDAGCTMIATNFQITATVGIGSTPSNLVTPYAAINQVGGYISYISGPNAGVQGTIKNVNVGSDITLAFPLPEVPIIGDTFYVYLGCDHSAATCLSVFNNLQNFKGFPYVPPPQWAQ